MARPNPSLPFEVDASGRSLLGMPSAEFLRDYWQKKPLLVRNALQDFVSPISPDDLAGLACEETALSRVVAHDREHDSWLLRHGPFPEAFFPTLPQHDWTLLVHDVDKWDADIRALLAHFDFLPRWRIDDVLASFAAPGGSVGAHVDQYDVFLLQAHGRRRWEIDSSPNPQTACRDDVELKMLQAFTPTHSWVLGPGDMLYLPPGVPHHGVAEDGCLTFSIGMRAPSAAELLVDFVDTLSADADEALRYHDPDLTIPADPNEIDASAMQRVVKALNALRMNHPDRLGDWFGNFITTYRSSGEIATQADMRPRIEVEWDLQRDARLLRHPWSRMAWRKASRGAMLYASGVAFALPIRDARALAAADSIDGVLYGKLSDGGRDAVFELLQAGHYQLQTDEEE